MLNAPNAADPSAIARYMGLPKWKLMDELALVDRVVQGLPISTVDALMKNLDPSGEVMEISHLIPKPSYYRHKENKKPLSKDKSEMVYALTRVFAEAMRIYYGRQDLVLAFLTREHALLNMRKPYDVARESTAGADLVMTMLGRAEAGVAA